MEIERKWEIGGFPAGLPQIDGAEMRQGYLCADPVVRIRAEERAGGSSYILCIKGRGTLAREEIETPISREVFERAAALIGVPLVHKRYRAYRLPDGRRLEVSLVDEGEETSFYYAEVEFASVEEARAFVPPAFLGRELTETPGASMSAYWQRRAAALRAGRPQGEEKR
ncbi:CYTH domain-containing protein [Anaerofilum sp. BX8]|uniref:CYTH domain-containing protein n=1 Tax=Anaerofilum hominis TaxID=2763016 RepID=A0A923IFG5_9FIRM|nr:CYTH domain-containing protein [Anaerofilum hominis]MBC5581912.1 CYTH domain-containing protein [Anaerofilum hominis]